MIDRITQPLHARVRACALLLTALALGACASPSAGDAPPIAARADGVVRAAAGAPVRHGTTTIDVDETVERLVALGCDAYLYEIPHGTDAWEKFPRFADTAARAGIDVQVYLAPWSLARRGGRNAENEPFGTDYVRWCDEVGRAARDRPNVRGVVMDDFQVNVGDGRFTPAVVTEMRAALRAHRDDLTFVPVLYYDVPLAGFFETFGASLGDGAILCYPRARREVELARRYFDDRERGASLHVELPRGGRPRAGRGTFAVARLDAVLARRAARLRFFLDDQDTIVRDGRHRAVVRVDGREVWSRTLDAGGVAGDLDVPLRKLRAGSRLELGLVADEPGEDSRVQIEFADVRVVDADGDTDHRVRWEDVIDDVPFEIAGSATGERRWSTPMTLLVAAAAFQHEKRFGEAGTPERIGSRVAQAMAWARDGLARGVIAWYPPLEDDADITAAIARAFRREAGRTRRR